MEISKISIQKINLLILATIILGVAALCWINYSDIDLELQRRLFDFETKAWLVDRNEPIAKFIFYKFPKICLGIFIVATLVATVLGFRKGAKTHEILDANASRMTSVEDEDFDANAPRMTSVVGENFDAIASRMTSVEDEDFDANASRMTSVVGENFDAIASRMTDKKANSPHTRHPCAQREDLMSLIQKLKKYRHNILLTLLGLSLIPLIAGNIKKFTNIYCPSQLEIYNGNYPYVKILESYPADFVQTKKGKCFPAGHAITGFSLLILFFSLHKKSHKIFGLILGTLLGWILGTYQMFKGAHFFGDTLIAMFVCFLLAALITRVYEGLLAKNITKK